MCDGINEILPVVWFQLPFSRNMLLMTVSCSIEKTRQKWTKIFDALVQLNKHALTAPDEPVIEEHPI